MSAPIAPLIDGCRVYRNARARYVGAFARGDVAAIEDAFSRMQEICRAFHDGARWAEGRDCAREVRPR